ncbi:MAG: FAD-dependent oxidoreductase [Candidatus Solibacter usitatus]|nr:FAD-dependent oxidoreductase [Candidatus Solibacter usitatus]
MPRVAILGGGLAGLAAAAALGGDGFDVDLYESRPFLGGRASSYPLPGDSNEVIDNCQHILLRCCPNLLDFYRRMGVEDSIHFHKEFFFIETGGRVSTLNAGILPAPFHFTESFARLKFLGLSDKIAIARALLAIRGERNTRKDLARITMLDWLREKKQTTVAIERFWRQILVSAINEELHLMAAVHGFQVFWLGFLCSSTSYELGIPSVPLGLLYDDHAWARIPGVKLHERCPVERIDFEGNRVARIKAGPSATEPDAIISALPFERLLPLAPHLSSTWNEFSHSPITGIHLWFDRPVTKLPHATLLDRTIQWMFNKSEGRYLLLVVSASRELIDMGRNEVLEMALRELREFFPGAKDANVVKAHVVKEVRATFSATPQAESRRPPAETPFENFFLAGDWTRSGWPATMEGAVRSGYIAAEAAAAYFSRKRRFLIPDIA